MLIKIFSYYNPIIFIINTVYQLSIAMFIIF